MRYIFARVLFAFIMVFSPLVHSDTHNYFQVVFDTTPSFESDFQLGFGYAVYVNYDGRKILFDTGVDGDTLLNNLHQAQVSISELDAAVISHRHPDHIGGLPRIRDVYS